MEENTRDAFRFPASSVEDVLTGLLRAGARRMLAQAVEAEVAGYIDRYAEIRDAAGHRLVVRNGHLPEREILTGLGPLPVRQPRVNDKRIDEDGNRMRFTSEILPRTFARRGASRN